MMVEDDVQLFRKPTCRTISTISSILNVQQQETMTLSTQAFPMLDAKLKEFSHNIDLIKQYGQKGDTFQKRLDADRMR